MRYEDFEIEIASPDHTTGDYTLCVQSREGEHRARFRLPFESRLCETKLLELQLAVLRSVGELRSDASHETLREFGEQLFKAIFQPKVSSIFERTVRRAEGAGGVRIKLRIVPPELSVLPWELLYSADYSEYFGLLPNMPLVRYVEYDNPLQPLAIEPPLKILGLAVSPPSLPQLKIEHEKQWIDMALKDFRESGQVKFKWLEHGTWRELQSALRKENWHALHFIGHGDFDDQANEGVLVLQDEDATKPFLLTARQLGNLLHQRLRFVFLNCCNSAKASRANLFSSTAATLVRRGIPAVLAMQYEISDKAATEFSRTFYNALADAMPVDRAVSEARQAVHIARPQTAEWATPVLFTHSVDGTLFTRQDRTGENYDPEPKGHNGHGSREDPPEPAPEPPKPTPAPPDPPPVHPRIRTEIDWRGLTVPVRLLVSLNDRDVRDRVRSMRERLTKSQPVFESKQEFHFTWDEVEPDLLLERLKNLLESSATEPLIIVVSDALARADGASPNRLLPTETTARIREVLLNQVTFGGLVAVVEGPALRAKDIEAVVGRHALMSKLPEAILCTADALRLKAPPPPPVPLADSDAFVVRLARTQSEMKECLRLRFDVYRRLGYLEERVANNPAEMELDCYDNRAIQFLAEDMQTGDVVGAARLLFPQLLGQELQHSVIGSPPSRTMEEQSRFRRGIAEAEFAKGNEILAMKLKETHFGSLPILNSNDFKEKTETILAKARSQVELSRVVVGPRHRGLGVSRLLIRVAIAVAWDLKRDRVLLECIPAHASMYEKYGFTRIHGHHGRDQDLDQLAVAMQLQLTRMPLDTVYATVNRDLEMIRWGRKDPSMLFGEHHHLCLCRDKNCWFAGAYSSRNLQSCGLYKLHSLVGRPQSVPYSPSN